MSFDAKVQDLGPLETFDPSAFLADEDTPQDLCDFVLALALAYNDLRDIFLARILLAEVAPTDSKTPTPHAALSNGLGIALLRAQAGTLHELLKLVAEKQSQLSHPIFVKTLGKLHKVGRSAWNAVVTAANNKPAHDPMTKALLFCRNKVAFHYDPKEIRRGYLLRFGSQSTNDPRPLLSRGFAMRNRRFYFADAAAEAYLVEKGNDPAVDLFFRGGGKLLDNVNAALYLIVTTFVETRGCAWRLWT